MGMLLYSGLEVAVDNYVAIGYMASVKEVFYTRAAIKVLRRIPSNVAARIEAMVSEYAADPALLANKVTALIGREGVRLRVGDWRIILHDGVVLTILEIGPRGGIYD
jgi:mRNA interferase RelE/StbE